MFNVVLKCFDKYPHLGFIDGGDVMMSSQHPTRDRKFIRQLGCGRRPTGHGSRHSPALASSERQLATFSQPGPRCDAVAGSVGSVV